MSTAFEKYALACPLRPTKKPGMKYDRRVYSCFGPGRPFKKACYWSFRDKIYLLSRAFGAKAKA